jgi:predicted secreted protein
MHKLFDDRSTLWRVPLLAFVTATGVGSVVTLGYAFSVQEHVANGGDDQPDFDLDYLWYGAKYAFALLVLAVPAYGLVGGLAMPAFLEVAQAGIDGASMAAAWDAAAGRLALFAVLFALWISWLFVILPASMATFLMDDGRVLSALDPARGVGFMRQTRGDYVQAVVFLFAGAATVALLYFPLQFVVPAGSTLPLLIVLFVVLPLMMAVLLVLSTMLGIARRRIVAEDPHASRDGWHTWRTRASRRRTPSPLLDPPVGRR